MGKAFGLIYTPLIYLTMQIILRPWTFKNSSEEGLFKQLKISLGINESISQEDEKSRFIVLVVE